MNRMTVLFALMILAVQPVSGKIAGKPARKNIHEQMLQTLLRHDFAAGDAQRTTAGVTLQRVVAQSIRYNAADSLMDSISLNYGTNRGSTYDYNDLVYSYNYPYSTTPMFNYAGAFTKPQVLFDTMMHWGVDPNTLVYGYYETDQAVYDTHRNTTSYEAMPADHSIGDSMKFTNSFDSHNNITGGYWFLWTSGSTDSAFKQFFKYNTSELLTEDSVYEYHNGAWHLVSKTYYTYDASSNLIQIDNIANDTDTTFAPPTIEQLKYVNTYDASGRLLSVASSFYDGTALAPYIRDTFAYTSTYTFHTSWKEYQYDPINGYWAPMFNMSKSLNAVHLPDTVYIQGFDSIMNAWVPQTMDILHYNSANNPDTLNDFEYNFTAYPSTPDYTTVYYYQNYVNTLGVTAQTAEDNNAIVFPDPTKGQFTISGLAAQINKPVTITIISINGQTIYRQSSYWQGSGQMSLADVAPGIYTVLVQDGSGALLLKKAVVKQ
jgi:Secretion system C-terminal sorting domain